MTRQPAFYPVVTKVLQGQGPARRRIDRRRSFRHKNRSCSTTEWSTRHDQSLLDFVDVVLRLDGSANHVGHGNDHARCQNNLLAQSARSRGLEPGTGNLSIARTTPCPAESTRRVAQGDRRNRWPAWLHGFAAVLVHRPGRGPGGGRAHRSAHPQPADAWQTDRRI